MSKVTLPIWKVYGSYNGFDHCRRVRHVIGHAIREEEESRYCCIWQIIPSVCPEFEEVEEGEQSQEEPRPPKSALFFKGEVGVEEDRGEESTAETEGSDSDTGLRALMAREEVIEGYGRLRSASYSSGCCVALEWNFLP